MNCRYCGKPTLKTYCSNICLQKWHYRNSPKYKKTLKKGHIKRMNKIYKDSRDRICNNKLQKILKKYYRIVVDNKGNIFKNMVEAGNFYETSKQRIEQCLKQNSILHRKIKFSYYKDI